MKYVFLAAWMIMCLSPVAVGKMASSTSQFGVTWTFDKAYEVGQFANGDWWVLGPVTITGITPKTTDGMHGSMLNPKLRSVLGFDKRMQHQKYTDAMNVATQLPLTIKSPSSLMSAVSLEEKSKRDNPQLKTIAILTVLLEKPSDGSFRPPYQGTDKTILGTVEDLDLSVLGKVKPLANTPKNYDKAAEYYARPWIELVPSWTGRYTHPRDNQPPYGREIAHRLTTGLIMLNVDVPDSQKRQLLINLVQIGIDVYGAARLGASWNADGGHNPGRKLPLILAGLALKQDDILTYADGTKQLFQEDQQTFIVSEKEVAITNSPKWKPDKRRKNVPYVKEDIGMAEWGIRHHHEPNRDAKNWDAMYRQINNATFPGIALAARMMTPDVETLWNHQAFFAYVDRVMAKDKGQAGKGVNTVPKWIVSLWDARTTTTKQ